MSDHLLRLIPTDPCWTPGTEAATAAISAFTALCPGAGHVYDETTDLVMFVDCAGNFETIGCPSCNGEIPLPWWQSAMDAAWEQHFSDLSVSTPCCAAAASLNDLDYQWPMGFARWQLTARNPDRWGLTAAEKRVVESAVGHPLRQIWAHD